ERGHAGARHAVHERVADVLIARGAAKLLTREADARDAVAISGVTQRAVARVDPEARLNLGRAVLTVLRLRHRAIGGADKDTGTNERKSQSVCKSRHGQKSGLSALGTP